MQRKLRLAVALLVLAIAGFVIDGRLTARAAGPLDCGADLQTTLGDEVQIGCSHSSGVWITSSTVDWGDSSSQFCPVSPPMTGTISCPAHEYGAVAVFTATVKASSFCPPGMICLCPGELYCGPCSNIAGGELCDDVQVTVAGVGVGGLTELASSSAQPSAAGRPVRDTSPAVLLGLMLAIAGGATFVAFAWLRNRF